ncbi:MAG: hypothetical protein K6B14_04810 [Lachnospiraceae bacterium]|nr:hypothetical protein [Lachnospiraceae bacterium]
MEGKVFSLDIIRDWGIGVVSSKKKEPMDPGSAASIKKLAAHYLKNGRASNMEEAISMARSILR